MLDDFIKNVHNFRSLHHPYSTISFLPAQAKAKKSGGNEK